MPKPAAICPFSGKRRRSGAIHRPTCRAPSDHADDTAHRAFLEWKALTSVVNVMRLRPSPSYAAVLSRPLGQTTRSPFRRMNQRQDLSMLTVVLSNYNHARFLPHALSALFAQSRPADEIILIDDASTDGSVAVIEAHLSRHPNICLLRNRTNLGVVANLNRGLELARGNKVYFAAADDIAYPTLFEKSIALLDRHPRAALCSSRCDIINSEGSIKREMVTPMPRSSPGYIEPSAVACQLMRDDSWFMGPTTLWRREPLFAVGGFPEELAAFTDGYVSRFLALKHGACFLPETLAAWRRMPGGMAWSQTVSTDAEKFTQLVEKKMAASGGVFPPGYAQRWKRRHLFGVRRFALVQERHAARGQGLTRQVVEAATGMFLTVWLFMKLRPFDLVAVARRRLQRMVSG